ncbi:hypothetical protein B0H66DRAFT_636270 [Apodospora peruviana]|uniref:Protein kinase domain-containing protein n=1 Tax=Apodospora peruviana TaxID=516989 RepID=A0AAE0IUM2_9PEZI|nr:hypothetical protein B0H66DRAFT_636270 [Apodospora peruviana]
MSGFAPQDAPIQNSVTGDSKSNEYLAVVAPIYGRGNPLISDTGRTAKPSVIIDLGSDLRCTLRRTTDSIPLSFDASRHGDLEDAITRHIIASAASTKTFLPEGQIVKLINEESVKLELKEFQRSMGKRILNRALGLGIPSRLSDTELDDEAARLCGNRPSAPDMNHKSYRKILAILLLIDRPSRIRLFVEEGVSDNDLPLELIRYKNSYDLRIKERLDEKLQCFKVRGKRWRSSTLVSFERYQWALLAPFFGQYNRKLPPHFKVPPQAVLPFTTWEDIRRQGSYGRVYKAEIHPDHHAFHVKQSCQPEEGNKNILHDRESKNQALDDQIRSAISFSKSSSRTHIFAVKRLHSDSRGDGFRHEFDMLRRIRRHHHPHLITLLATYEQCGYFHFIFPFADSDLEAYWRNNVPMNNHATVLWLAEQCRGLAGAVAAIHSHISPKPDPNNNTSTATSTLTPPLSGSFVRCRHGDIKPKNILLFSDTSRIPLESPTSDTSGTQQRLHESQNQDPRFILKITDFGAAQLTGGRHASSTSSSIPQTTPNYRAPEADIAAYLTEAAGSASAGNDNNNNNGNDIIIDTSYDIWALGCVFLEFIAWFFGPGWRGVEDFYNERSKDVDPLLKPYRTGKFFVLDFDYTAGGGLEGVGSERGNITGVRVKPEVHEFARKLYDEPRTSCFFHEFLRLILDEMMVIEQDVNLSPTSTGGSGVTTILTSKSRRRSRAENIEKKLAEMIGRGTRTGRSLETGEDGQSGYDYLFSPLQIFHGAT